jgi:hypothetical protein
MAEARLNHVWVACVISSTTLYDCDVNEKSTLNEYLNAAGPTIVVDLI